VGDDGDLAININTGDTYTKFVGSWVLGTGGGGGGSASLVGTVDPEGSVTAAAGTLYTNRTTHTLWVKETGAGNTGWIEYIGP
jgi:hypothetical protein